MTLPLNSRLSALYDTNGTQRDFGFGFRVFFDPDNGGYGLEVRRQTADGYEVIPKSDYLVLPVEDNSAGIVRFNIAPSAGQQIYIAGKTPTIQQLVLTNFGRYSAESIETQFDFITAIIQEWLSALGEETRQRIAADEILTQYVVQRIDDFVQQVNQNWNDKSQEIEEYIATIMPSFTQTLREEIEAFAVAGMQDAIDQTLAESKAELDEAVARANAAALAAAITGKVYDTPNAGVDPVTGVADGAYFNVRSPNNDSYIDEYQNVGGVATPTGKSYPSAAALEAQRHASGITDKSGLTQQEVNDLYITPFQFGAVGDGTSHKLSERYATLSEAQAVYPQAASLDDEIDWCALQTMINFALSQGDNRKSTIDWSGNFYLNKGLRYIVDATGTGAYRSINGDLHFTLRNDFDQTYDSVITIHGRGIAHTGVISGSCGKLVDNGVVVSSRGISGGVDYINFGIKIDRVLIDHARLFAVDFRNNSMFSTLNLYRGGGCGTGSIGVNNLLKTNFNAKADSGVGGISSSSVITVDTLPPYAVDKTTTFISSGGYVSKVTEINTANNQITVKPHLPTASTGEISYIFGGGVKVSGVDSASCYIEQISAIGCGIALAHQTMYPATVASFTTEFSGIAIYENGLASGANILTHYIEGDEYVLIVDNTSAKAYGSTELHHGLPLNFSAVSDISWGRNSDGSTIGTYAGLNGVSIKDKTTRHHMNTAKLPNNVLPNGVDNGFGIDFNKPHDNLVVKANNITIGIMPIDTNFNRLFAYDSQELTVVGTGSNGSPTDTITITPVTGYTLNGGTANLSFSGFNSAANFTFFLDVAIKDIKVSVSGIRLVPASVVGRLTTGATEQLDVDTKLWFYSNTSATGLPLPTTGIMADGNITTYFSLAAVGSAHRKTQVVHYPDLFETWERVYASSSGAYGVWRLIDYQVSKGATAQRPSNPQIGIRYYDTTLLAAGKPIEWNGSNWVDATGATV